MLIGDPSPREKESPVSSHANVGRHLGGSCRESAEPTYPADSRATGYEPTSRLFTHESSHQVAHFVQAIVSGSRA
jgi:hypothetical protein